MSCPARKAKPSEPTNLIAHGGGPWHPVGTPCPCVWHRIVRALARAWRKRNQ